MFNLDDYKTVLKFVDDLKEIDSTDAREVINVIDRMPNDTNYVIDFVEKGMRLIFEKHGFKHYMKYEDSFCITIFWRDKDQAFYLSELKKLNTN